MKLAVISDLHADVEALQEALGHIDAMGCDLIVCLGDLVDRGVFPEETIALIRERNIPCIMGNHDLWAIKDGADVSGWSLSKSAIEYLESLPKTWKRSVDGVRVVAWHSTPGDKTCMHGIYPDEITDSDVNWLLDNTKADILLVGHTHIPFVTKTWRGMIANPGTLSRIEDDEHGSVVILGGGRTQKTPVGTFGVLKLPEQTFAIYSVTSGERIL